MDVNQQRLLNGAIAFILLLTIVFANFAEAVAEGRGKAQADALRAMRSDTTAKKILELTVRITADPGQGFIDRTIALVEGAERTKTPNEMALTVLLAVLTLVFLIVVANIPPLANYIAGFLSTSVGQEQASRRSLWRHQHPGAGQDGHDYPGKPPGQRVHSGERAQLRRSRPSLPQREYL